MFDLLTGKKKRKLSVSEVNPVQAYINEEYSKHAEEQRMVDSFIKKNTFNGGSIMQYSVKLLSLLAHEREISQGAFYISDMKDGKSFLKFLSGFATPDPDNNTDLLEFGEGFPGQVAKDGTLMNISDIPEGYLTIESGLGKSSPVSLLIFPVKDKEKVIAVIELASFHKFSTADENYFTAISHSICDKIKKCMRKS